MDDKEQHEKEIVESELNILDAEIVNMRQSTARSVEGSHVEMEQVGAISIDAERLEASQTASLIVHGNDVNLNQSISGITISNNTGLGYSLSPLILTRSHTDIRDSASGIIISKNITSKNTRTLFLIANKVEGDVKTVFDWKSAISLGAVIGGVLGFFSLLKNKK